MAKPLSFKDMLTVEYRPGEDELINYRVQKRKRTESFEHQNCGTPDCCGECEPDLDEALTIQQRMARGRLMKRMKSRIKIGRERAKRRMANKDVLLKRARKAARKAVLKKLTKGKDKSDLPFARRQELEKRLDKPAVKKRIEMLTKRMLKDVRKKEVARKKG